MTSSRPVSRTATFAFFIGDRHFGVITASVSGRRAGNFHFTSVLPVELLNLLAPAIETRLHPASGVVPEGLGRDASLWANGQFPPFQSTSLQISSARLMQSLSAGKK